MSERTAPRTGRLWIVAGVVLVAAVSAAVLTGPAGLPWKGVVLSAADHVPFVHVHSGLSATESAVLWQIRVPRIVLGGIVGWMLAASGAGYQGVFRNPLADPYLLGAAAGAGVGATVVIAYAPSTHGCPVDPIPLAAFVGAILAVALTYVVATTADRRAAAAPGLLGRLPGAALFSPAPTLMPQH